MASGTHRNHIPTIAPPNFNLNLNLNLSLSVSLRFSLRFSEVQPEVQHRASPVNGPGPAAHPMDILSGMPLRPSPFDREAALAVLAELQEVERSLWAVRDELRKLLEDGQDA